MSKDFSKYVACDQNGNKILISSALQETIDKYEKDEEFQLEQNRKFEKKEDGTVVGSATYDGVEFNVFSGPVKETEFEGESCRYCGNVADQYIVFFAYCNGCFSKNTIEAKADKNK